MSHLGQRLLVDRRVFVVTVLVVSGCSSHKAPASNPDAVVGQEAGSGQEPDPGTDRDSGVGDGSVATPDAWPIDQAPFVGPSNHPYISLSDFDGVDTAGGAFTRLKAQVDDVVKITLAQPAGATFSALMDKISPNHYGYSCADAIVMYRITHDAKYLTQAITLVDAFIAEENTKISSNTNPTIAGDSYYSFGGLMEQIALTYDYGYASLSAGQRTTWETYANQATQNLWNPNSAKWGSRAATWSGWALDDPGNNYYFNFIKGTMLWALASQNKTWLDFLTTKKLPQLQTYFAGFKGGGSREGTGYGTSLGSLFENYRYWRSSTGDDLSAKSSHARDTIDYWLHATVPTLQYFASIGDQARRSMTAMFDYQRHLMLEAVRLSANTPQGARGAWWLSHVPVLDGSDKPLLGRMAYAFNYRYDLLAAPGATEQAPTDLAYYAEAAGVMFARSAWTTTASWLSTVAGIYDQSHAHQDQGSFSLYKGTWLAAPANLVSNSGLHAETSAHNMVRFENSGKLVGQTDSTSTMTSKDEGGVLTIDEDLSPAYAKSSGAVKSWKRTLVYTRAANKLDVHDTCTVSATVKPIFQVILPLQTTAPTVSGSVVTANGLKITQTLPAVGSANPPTVVSLKTLPESDFSGGYRIELGGAGCEFQVTLEAL